MNADQLKILCKGLEDAMTGLETMIQFSKTQADRIAELEKDLHMIQRHYDQLDTQTNNKNRSWSDIYDEATAVWDSLDTSNQSNIECARAWFLEGYHQALTRGQE